jgi:hypothetical protein
MLITIPAGPKSSPALDLIWLRVEGARVQQRVCGVNRRLGDRDVNPASDVTAAACGFRDIVAAAGALAILTATQRQTPVNNSVSQLRENVITKPQLAPDTIPLLH